MFEHSLIDLEAKPPQRRRWISLPIAVGLHMVGLTALAFASYWSVGSVPEPDRPMDPYHIVTLPDLPGGGGRGPQRPPVREPERQEQTPPDDRQPVQPTEQSVPDEVPPAATTAPVDDFLDDLVLSDGGGDDPGPAGDCPTCPVGPGVGPGPVGPGAGPGGGEGDDLAPIRFTVGMTRPEPLHRVQPRYTEAARKAGVQGTVIVEAIIDEKGNVRDARVLRGLPLGLDREAVDAILQWKFRPALLNDRPVRVYFNLTATFTIQR